MRNVPFLKFETYLRHLSPTHSPHLSFYSKTSPLYRSYLVTYLGRHFLLTYRITTSPHLTSKLHLFIMILPPSSLPLFHLNSYLKTYLKSIVRNSYSLHFFPTFALLKNLQLNNHFTSKIHFFHHYIN